jgi:hypothetical protein
MSCDSNTYGTLQLVSVLQFLSALPSNQMLQAVTLPCIVADQGQLM